MVFCLLPSLLKKRRPSDWASKPMQMRCITTDTTVPLGPKPSPGRTLIVTVSLLVRGSRTRDCMLFCLLKKASHKAVKWEKLKEVTQRPDENAAIFMSPLTEALTKFTRMDSTSKEGQLVLNNHFINQSAPDTRKKLKHLEDGPNTAPPK